MSRRYFVSRITAIGFLVTLAISIPSYSGGRGDAALQGIAGALDSISQDLERQAEVDRQLEAQKKLLEYRYELERRRIEEVDSKHREEERAREAQREQERQAQLAADERRKREAEEARKHAVVTGTGFFIAPNGYLITNNHVVEDRTHFAIRDRHGDFYRAEVVAQDANRDLALLRVQGTFPSLKIARSDTVSKGQRVMAVGYPQVSIQGNESKVTDGVISSFSGVNNDPNWFQISTPIQGGNSGGPLVTESGQVVGVVVATANAVKFLKQTGNIPQNVNYAIKANALLSFLAERNISNIATTSGRATIDAVDRATVLIVAKDGPIDVTFLMSPEQRAAQERENAKNEAEAEKKTQALAKAEDERRRKGQGIADQRARQEAATTNAQRSFTAGVAAYRNGDIVAAIGNFRSAADAGYAQAQVSLGFLYEQGKGGLPKDDVEAVRLYRLAAAQGNGSGQTSLGTMYATGRSGLPKDEVEAARLYRLAAAQGNGFGQANLGVMYENGRGGLPKDDVEAARLYRLAADQGVGRAQNNLGVMYLNGRGGLPKDDVEAVRLFQLAADQGVGPAQNNLGVMYENGRGGLTKDADKAASWYRLAARQGEPQAIASLDRLGRQ